MAAVTFDQALDFTRGSEGTYIGPEGLIKTAAVDEPRFTHDPETGNPHGLLIEEQRTNLYLHSSDFAQSVWTKIAGVDPITVESAVGPQLIAGTPCDRLTMPSNSRIVQGYSGEAERSNSWLIKYESGEPQVAVFTRTSSAVFDIVSGVVVSGNGIIKSLGLGFFKCTLVSTDSQSSGQLRAVGEGGTYFVAGAQLEEGSSPSSYIKTEGSQVTRAADNCSRTLGAEFRNDKGRFIVTAKAPVGTTILAAGTLSVVSDSEDLKEYDVSYDPDIEATDIQIVPSGNGVVESIYYLPTPEAN